jgi:hypothetical protein
MMMKNSSGPIGTTLLLVWLTISLPSLVSACDPNLITDGNFDLADLVVFAEQWLNNNCSPNDWCEGADFDNSGKVDFTDFAFFGPYWLKTPQTNPPVNLVVNGDFETGSGQQPWPWTKSYQSSGGNGTVDSSIYHSGTASYKMWGTSTNSKFRLDSGVINVTGKTSYLFSTWIKSDISSAILLYLYIDYYDANYTLLEEKLFKSVTGIYDWTNYSWTFSTRRNCAYIKVRIFFYLSNGTAYIDDVAIYQLDSPSTSLTWDEIVANGQVAYNHFMNQRVYPYYFSTRYNYHTHTNESVALPYLIHSIYQYLITSDEAYLNTTKRTADDIRNYLFLGVDNCVYSWNPVTHSRTTATLETHDVATILHSLILLARIDNSYIALAERITNGIVNKYINPNNNLLCSNICSAGYGTNFANEEMLIVKDLLMMYELTGNITYRDKALDILIASWALRDPVTNLLGISYYPDGTVIDPEMKQGGTGGGFLNSLNYAYYITQDPTVKTMIEDYSQAMNNYIYSDQLKAYRYRTYTSGWYNPSHNIYEFCYGWLDDAMIRAYHITNNPTTYTTANTDFNTSFMDWLTIRNFLVVHGTNPNGNDYTYQSVIYHTFSIPFVGYMMYLETGDESYLDLSIQFYHQLMLKHKRENPAGYIVSINPYTFEDESYLGYLSSPQAMFLPTIMVPLLIRPVNATVDWNLGFNKPMSGTYLTPVEYRNVSFDYASKTIAFDSITKDGFRGHIKLPGMTIKEVKLPNNEFAIYTDNDTFYVNEGTDSYTVTVSGEPYDVSLPRLSSISDPCVDVLKAIYNESTEKIELTLEGTSSVELHVEHLSRPNFPGVAVISSENTVTVQADVDGQADINFVNMSVTPSVDSVAVTIDNWQTEEPYCKKWTEFAVNPSITTAHVVGDLSAGKYYTVWYIKNEEDKAILETEQADSSGKIAFTYAQGYPSVIFEIEEETQ